MIKFKNNKIRVRCLECREEHFIEMKLIGTEKEQRTISFEYEYTYRGEQVCSYCGEKMRVLSVIYEYPKGFLSYIDNGDKSCLIMDDMDENSLIVDDTDES